jgi:hypothetical protein
MVYKLFCFLLFCATSAGFVFEGSTRPLGYFDPLGFSKDTDLSKKQFYREAELKHGRIGMVSAITIPAIEAISHKSALHDFDELPVTIQLGLTGLMFSSEFASMLKGWKNPFESKENVFQLKEDYQPGDLGFSLGDDLSSDKGKELLNKELNNGRLAMIASAGMIAQELVTKQSIF